LKKYGAQALKPGIFLEWSWSCMPCLTGCAKGNQQSNAGAKADPEGLRHALENYNKALQADQ